MGENNGTHSKDLLSYKSHRQFKLKTDSLYDIMGKRRKAQ
jgi:hypothetical protein